MFHITENTSAARGEEGLSARHNRALRSDLVNSKLPSRLCDSYKGPHVVGSEWGIADPQPFRVTEDFWAGGWSNYIFNTMQNGPQQKETVGRRNNGGIPGEVQSQDHRERLAGAYVGCITVGTEIGGRVNLNLNWPPFSTQVRRETWAEALSGRESTYHEGTVWQHWTLTCKGPTRAVHAYYDRGFHIRVQEMYRHFLPGPTPIFTPRSTFIWIGWRKKMLSYGFKLRSFTGAMTANVFLVLLWKSHIQVLESCKRKMFKSSCRQYREI